MEELISTIQRVIEGVNHLVTVNVLATPGFDIID